ncbi:class I SAM-dependent methyltransferase [Echinicola sediminis]
MFGNQAEFDYLQCGKCKTLQIVTIPDDLSVYYPKDYYSLEAINKSPYWKRLIKTFRYALFRKTKLDVFKHYHYGEWLKELNLPLSSKIADVGCGNGQLLYEFYASGYRDLVGIDPFIDADTKVNDSLLLLKKSLFEIDQKFDCIMMHHSFEHMERPKDIIQKAGDLLKSGGKLLVRIPLANKAAWKEYGVNWVQLDAPRHFYLHTEESLIGMAESAGFVLSKTVYDSNSFQFWGSELCKIGVPLKEAELEKHFSEKKLGEFTKRSLDLNAEGQGDQACFYFRKA